MEKVREGGRGHAAATTATAVFANRSTGDRGATRLLLLRHRCALAWEGMAAAIEDLPGSVGEGEGELKAGRKGGIGGDEPVLDSAAVVYGSIEGAVLAAASVLRLRAL